MIISGKIREFKSRYGIEKYARTLKCFSAMFHFARSCTCTYTKLICIEVALIYSTRNCEQKDYAS